MLPPGALPHSGGAVALKIPEVAVRTLLGAAARPVIPFVKHPEYC